MKIVLLALAPQFYYRNPLVPGSQQLFIGPDVSPLDSSFKNKCLRVDLFNISSQTLINIFRSYDWWPDLIFVKADATRRIYIHDIDNLPGRKILLMGDTHHLSNPIEWMLKYALNEPWDLISSEHDRHHLSIFKDAGIKNLIWLPCFTMNPFQIEPNYHVDKKLVFVGSTGPLHIYRRHILHQLHASKININVQTASQQNAARIYNNNMVSLNISLNGDFNFRIMEVLEQEQQTAVGQQ